MDNEAQILQQKKMQLKALQEKCELQNVITSLGQKKIKLYRKENEEIKHALARQAQIDTSLLLNSKELSDANSKLEAAIQDISRKLQIDLDNLSGSTNIKTAKPVALVTIQNTTVTQQTQQIDLPSQQICDDDILQLQSFKGLKSLLFGQNKIGDIGVKIITGYLTEITKLQLNSNKFTYQSLIDIGRLKNLRVLDIRNNNLGDQCLRFVADVATLQELSASKNGITDKGTIYLSKLTNLTYLDLTTNLITNQGVKNIGPLQKLTHLYLMSNRVNEDSVFFIYENIKRLQVLDVRFNINDAVKKEQIRGAKPEKLQLFC